MFLRLLLTFIFGVSSVIVMADPMDLTRKQLESGLKKFLNADPSCRNISVPSARPVRDGAAFYYQPIKGRSNGEMLAVMDGAKRKIQSVELSYSKDEASMSDVLCGTYALMRTLQPEYQTHEGAQKEAIRLWREASKSRAGFKAAYFFDFVEVSSGVGLTFKMHGK